jgi:catechol 2,3-dioxygenase-like lactoylglutathione lyase family enzyme
MIQAKRLGHVTLQTPDLDKTLAHYTRICGLVETARDKNSVFLATRIGQLALELKRAPAAMCEKLSFEVSAARPLADLTRELTGLGLKPAVQSDPAPSLSQVISFTDPKGTVIELFADWRNVGKTDNAAEVAAVKMGHLAFMVEDPKATAEFYEKVLGFRVSDWIEDQFVFMRCNTDHHTVNFIKGDRVKMHHFAFEYRDFAHVNTAAEMLGQKDVPIIWGPLRLGPGHNIAIFHQDPDGQVVEFYAELDKMLDEELGYFEPRPWHRDQPQRPRVWSKTKTSIWGLPPGPAFPKHFHAGPGQKPAQAAE